MHPGANLVAWRYNPPLAYPLVEDEAIHVGRVDGHLVLTAFQVSCSLLEPPLPVFDYFLGHPSFVAPVFDRQMRALVH